MNQEFKQFGHTDFTKVSQIGKYQISQYKVKTVTPWYPLILADIDGTDAIQQSENIKSAVYTVDIDREFYPFMLNGRKKAGQGSYGIVTGWTPMFIHPSWDIQGGVLNCKVDDLLNMKRVVFTAGMQYFTAEAVDYKNLKFEAGVYTFLITNENPDTLSGSFGFWLSVIHELEAGRY